MLKQLFKMATAQLNCTTANCVFVKKKKHCSLAQEKLNKMIVRTIKSSNNYNSYNQ